MRFTYKNNNLFYVGLLAICLLFSNIGSATAEDKMKKFAVYYTDIAKPSEFKEYDVIVFDGDHHPELRSLKNDDRVILSYISLFEAAYYRKEYKSLKKKKLLFKVNGKAGNSEDDKEYIDVRNIQWAKIVIEELVPKIVGDGFDGIMVDTLDSAIALELSNPIKYSGLMEASVDLIKAIRMHYPYIKIMVNRSFQILPEMAGDIDMVLLESTMVHTDLENKTHQLYKQDVYGKTLELMAGLKVKNNQLELYGLDYWNMQESEKVKNIYSKHRESGVIPYVSTADLQKLHVEPK